MKFIMTNTTCLFQVCGIHFVFLKRSYLQKWLENMTDPSGDSNVVATFLSKIASNIKASKHYYPKDIQVSFRPMISLSLMHNMLHYILDM